MPFACSMVWTEHAVYLDREREIFCSDKLGPTITIRASKVSYLFLRSVAYMFKWLWPLVSIGLYIPWRLYERAKYSVLYYLGRGTSQGHSYNFVRYRPVGIRRRRIKGHAAFSRVFLFLYSTSPLKTVGQQQLLKWSRLGSARVGICKGPDIL
jgi:hypothetical protein